MEDQSCQGQGPQPHTSRCLGAGYSQHSVKGRGAPTIEGGALNVLCLRNVNRCVICCRDEMLPREMGGRREEQRPGGAGPSEVTKQPGNPDLRLPEGIGLGTGPTQV